MIALVVAYRRQRYSEREHIRAEAAAVREDTKLYTERFRAAADQIGSDKAAVRLASVYAMASLADDWDAEQQTCIDVLCAYLRMPHAVRKAKDNGRPRRDERQVRSTVANLIGPHLRDTATVSWQGRDFDFTGATIEDGDFSDAVFKGGKISFNRARFSGGVADFTQAQFTGGEVGFYGARFGDSGSVLFDGAQFAGASVVFIEARLDDATLAFSRASFTDGRVDFRGAYLDMGFVLFDDAEFSGGVVDFTASRLSCLVDFKGTRVNGGEILFTMAELSGGVVHFNGTDVTEGEVVFDEAVLSGCDIWFRLAKLTGGTVNFPGAHFVSGTVDFNDAQLTGSEVNFRGAEFAGGVVDLSGVDKYDVPAKFDWTTRPDGLRLPGDPVAPSQRTSNRRPRLARTELNRPDEDHVRE